MRTCTSTKGEAQTKTCEFSRVSKLTPTSLRLGTERLGCPDVTDGKELLGYYLITLVGDSNNLENIVCHTFEATVAVFQG